MEWSGFVKFFRFLVLGNAISAYGSYLNMLALNLFAYQLSGSALFSGIFLAVRLAVGFVTGFVAGRIPRHRRRKPLMIAAEMSQAVALLVLVFSPAVAQQEILYAVAVVTGIGSTVSQVALRSMVPELVGLEMRTQANGLLVTSRSIAMVLGFASAGAVLGWIGYHAAFLIDAATFGISAVILSSLPSAVRISGGQEAMQESGPDGGSESFLAAHRSALGFLWTVPILLSMIAIRGIDGLGSASHNVALPIYSSNLDPQHPAAFMSRFWVLWAVGNIFFLQLLSRYTKKDWADLRWKRLRDRNLSDIGGVYPGFLRPAYGRDGGRRPLGRCR